MSDERAGAGSGSESDSDSGSDSDAGTGASHRSRGDAERDGVWKDGQAPVGREPESEDGVGEGRDLDGEESDEEHEPSVAGVFGARPDDAPPRREIVPERIDPENALFLLLGALFGLFVVYRAVVVFTA